MCGRACTWSLPLLLLISTGCARSGETLPLVAAFSDDSIIGQLDVHWAATGAAGEITVQVDVVNRLSEPMYVRVRDLVLVGSRAEVAVGAVIACRARPGTTPDVVRATVAAGDLGTARGIRADRFAVPLSERGRAFYREFLLGQRPGDADAIDAEIAAYAAAPECGAAAAQP
jgi:hypothetical protein